MNAKICKMLRGKARGLSTGMPARRLLWKRGRQMKTNAVIDICIINDPNSTRGIYRKLKKEAAHG